MKWSDQECIDAMQVFGFHIYQAGNRKPEQRWYIDMHTPHRGDATALVSANNALTGFHGFNTAQDALKMAIAFYEKRSRA